MNNFVDAYLDAPDNAISDIETSSEMLTSQSQKLEYAKTDNAKDLCRSLEIKPIMTFDTEFPTIFNKSLALSGASKLSTSHLDINVFSILHNLGSPLG